MFRRRRSSGDQNSEHLGLSNIDWPLGSWLIRSPASDSIMISCQSTYVAAAADPALKSSRAEPALDLVLGARRGSRALRRSSMPRRGISWSTAGDSRARQQQAPDVAPIAPASRFTKSARILIYPAPKPRYDGKVQSPQRKRQAPLRNHPGRFHHRAIRERRAVSVRATF